MEERLKSAEDRIRAVEDSLAFWKGMRTGAIYVIGLMGIGTLATGAWFLDKAQKLNDQSNVLISNIEGFANDAYIKLVASASKPTWHTLSPPSGSEAGGTRFEEFYSPSYSVDPFGRVTLRGIVKAKNNERIGQLLAQYRPEKTLEFVVPCDRPAEVGWCWLKVDKDGFIFPERGSETWIGLDGVSFLTK